MSCGGKPRDTVQVQPLGQVSLAEQPADIARRFHWKRGGQVAQA
jgi:hypothetical protein